MEVLCLTIEDINIYRAYKKFVWLLPIWLGPGTTHAPRTLTHFPTEMLAASTEVHTLVFSEVCCWHDLVFIMTLNAFSWSTYEEPVTKRDQTGFSILE